MTKWIKVALVVALLVGVVDAQHVVVVRRAAAAGESCPGGAEICDDFSADTITSGDWVEEGGSDFSIAGGVLTYNTASGSGYGIMRYDADSLDNTAYQVVCMQIGTAGAQYPGIFIRSTQATTGATWNVSFLANGNDNWVGEFEDRSSGSVDGCTGTAGAVTSGTVICIELDEGGGTGGDADIHVFVNPNSCTIGSDCKSSWDSAHTNWTPGFTKTADDADCTDSDATWPVGSYVGFMNYVTGSTITYFEAWSSAS